MMDFWDSLGGMVTTEIVSADASSTISAFIQADIRLSDLTVDGLSLSFRILRKDLRHARKICKKRGEKIRVLGRNGLYWRIKGLILRPVLCAGILLFLFLGFWIPSRVFFVRVEGNTNIPTKLIIQEAAECGIDFGASRRNVRSEKMKNALLEAMPQLQWAGVNTRGCVATITVRERAVTESTQSSTGVSSIVAVWDGVIESCTAEQGNLVCKPGMAVKAGQTLISGYTDCGLTIRATQAKGEIIAKTQRSLTVCALPTCQQKNKKQSTTRKYALIIGKKRINFSKDSGIFTPSCDKMYVEKFLTLPGGFTLPISLVVETYVSYETIEVAVAEEAAQEQLSAFAEEYLKDRMVAGEILSKTESVSHDDDVFTLKGVYACREMIGRVQEEEIISPNGKFDGT